jgi:hypothetical protein
MNVHFFPPACRSTACWPAALTSERPPGRIAVELTAPHSVLFYCVFSTRALTLARSQGAPPPPLGGKGGAAAILAAVKSNVRGPES